MSRLKRDRYQKKLQRLLSRADDESFFQLVWALDALQSGRENAAARLINFPKEAATSEITSPFAAHKWALESLVGQLLVTPKSKVREGPNRRTNCTEFNTGAVALNLLRELENEESGIYLKRIHILLEMHRIAQRQFAWQRGYLNVPRFYRYAQIYGQGECGSYFERTYGLSTHEFSLIGFVLNAAFQENPCIGRNYSLEQLGVKPATVDAALKLLSMPIQEARVMAESLAKEAGSGLATAYQPSFLRRFPIVSFGNDNRTLRAPLSQLIPLRITSGLYYDLVSGGQGLLNEANDRFESYAKRYIAAMMSRFDVGRSYQYGPKGQRKASPDIIIRDGGKISIVIECKAAKLTFEAQYAEDPVDTARKAYDQIAKGVFQLWRYFSHVRLGVMESGEISNDVRGVVLTLDTWLQNSPDLQKDVVATATEMANKDPDIIASDCRAVTFCNIDDLEYTLSHADEDSFKRALAAVDEDRFLGWVLPDIHRNVGLENEEPKPFPFELCEVLPWWDTLPN